MNTKILFLISILTLTLGASAQQRTADPLGPMTQCVNGDGFHYEKKDRLPPAVHYRTVETSSGPVQVSTADGYRLMVYRASSLPLINLKLERSVEGHFANDRLVITKQMQELAATSRPPNQASVETSMRNGIEILAINNSDTEHTPGVISLYTLLDASSGNVATAYVLQQGPELRDYAGAAEYAALRDRFIGLLSDCMSHSVQ